MNEMKRVIITCKRSIVLFKIKKTKQWEKTEVVNHIFTILPYLKHLKIKSQHMNWWILSGTVYNTWIICKQLKYILIYLLSYRKLKIILENRRKLLLPFNQNQRIRLSTPDTHLHTTLFYGVLGPVFTFTYFTKLTFIISLHPRHYLVSQLGISHPM